jgi:hypothetical protein
MGVLEASATGRGVATGVVGSPAAATAEEPEEDVAGEVGETGVTVGVAAAGLRRAVVGACVGWAVAAGLAAVDVTAAISACRVMLGL